MRKAYQSLAVVLLNTLLFFLALNAVLALVVPEPPSGPAAVYSEQELAAAYPGLSAAERNQLLRECYDRPPLYESYVLFKERPIQGKYVNVSPVGYRHGKNQAPWPPDPARYNIFVFGGSTTFGYGLADDQTIPSYLQEALGGQAAVYNFGAGYYYSTQERVWFERLLTQGYRPDLAIFIDGLNDFFLVQDNPFHTQRVRRVFDGHSQGLLERLPMVRLAGRLRKAAPQYPTYGLAEAQTVIHRYRANQKLIEGSGVKTLFVWQPVPCYKYDVKLHRFYDKPQAYQLHTLAYPEMERQPRDPNFLWLADLQENERECLYVDAHHYSASFSRKLAQAISRSAAPLPAVPAR